METLKGGLQVVPRVFGVVQKNSSSLTSSRAKGSQSLLEEQTLVSLQMKRAGQEANCLNSFCPVYF